MNKEQLNYYNEKVSYSLTYEDVVRIFKLIDNYNYSNLNIELGDMKLSIEKESSILNEQVTEKLKKSEKEVPSNSAGESPVEIQEQKEELHVEEKSTLIETEGFIPITTAISGVFYASPSPDQEPFVKVGSKVKKGDEIGLIEVMKLFNSVYAPCDGVIKEIYAENESVVNIDDTLMIIKSE